MLAYYGEDICRHLSVKPGGSLPLTPYVSDDDIEDVVRSVRRVVRAFRKPRW